MLPAMINVLAVVSSASETTLDVDGAMQRLKLAAEKRDPILYARQRYSSPADFFKGYERLSGLWWRPGEAVPSHLWINPQARQKMPAKVRKLLVVKSA